MKDYVIINGVSSKTKTGLAINILPPITKPKMRTLTEEIDGRDGDIITKLGYSAYDKTIEIGLFGNGYDVDDIIAFFNQEGTITFSNEPDKYYNFTLVDSFDIERLLQFKTSTITFHCQPFKYLIDEEPKEIEYQYVTDEGTEITLNNTKNALMQLELNPSELTQETTTGKNLLNITETLTFTTYQEIAGLNIPAGTYVFSCVDRQTSGANPSLFTFYNNNTTLTSNNFASDVKTRTITVSDTITKIALYSQDTYAHSNGVSITYKGLMLSTNGGDYEPYTGGIPQPNPSYPSEVQVIKGNNSIKIENKNLFDENTEFHYSTVGNGITNTNNYYNSTDYIKCNVGDKFTISGIPTTTTDFNFKLVFFDINKNFISRPIAELGTINTKFSGTALAPSNAKYVMAQFQKTVSMTQLEKGSTASDYVAHQEQVKTLTLGDKEICKIGNYEDIIFKAIKGNEIYDSLTTEEKNTLDYGKWYLNKYIGKVVLDGTESGWAYNSTYTNFNIRPFYLGMRSTSSATGYIPKICNYFKYYNSNGNIANLIDGIYENTNTTQLSFLLFHCDSLNITTLEDWKAWLNANKPIIYYQLETPTHTEITDSTLISQLNAIEQAVSYDEQTNISQTNAGLPFRIKATAMISGSESVEINNNGNIYAKPVLDIKGTGTINIYLNGTQMLSVNITDEIVIDVPNLEAYNPNTTALLNRNVTGDISKFILPVGTNTISVDGDVELVTITLYKRWL